MTKIKILASDILETSYLNCDECAITRALHRAGFYDLQDIGVGISKKHERNFILDRKNLEYLNLSQRILSMYSYKDNEDYINLESKVVEREEPKDFEVELPL